MFEFSCLDNMIRFFQDNHTDIQRSLSEHGIFYARIDKNQHEGGVLLRFQSRITVQQSIRNLNRFMNFSISDEQILCDEEGPYVEMSEQEMRIFADFCNSLIQQCQSPPVPQHPLPSHVLRCAGPHDSSSLVIPPSLKRIPPDAIMLRQPLGSGYFATVYNALYDGTDVAVKIPKPDPTDPDSISKEIAVLSIISNDPHPSILQLYGMIESPEEHPPYLIMEYCPHGSLYQYIVESQGEMLQDPRAWLQAAWGIAAGVVHLHGMDIVHRDLTPYNILIARLDPIQVKIGDFGLARQYIGSYLRTRTPDRGKPKWCAPEVHKRDPLQSPSEKSDIWSLGLLIWWLCENGRQLPFAEYEDTRPALGQMAQDIADGMRPSLVEAEQYGLAVLLSRCWYERPDERPSAAEVSSELRTRRQAMETQYCLQSASTGTDANPYYELQIK